MEILLAAVAGVAGVALLLQSKQPLPTEAEYKKAQDKLTATPEDPDANTIVGKYVSFVVGDYQNGMMFLEKSSDKTLKTLAQHERAPLYTDTAPKKVSMGDEWVVAAKQFPALFRIFYDRASQWYATAWPDLEGPWKDKAREQGKKLAASRPPGGAKKGLPTGWQAEAGIGGAKPPILDGSLAHTGSYSVKVVPGDDKVKGSWSAVKSDPVQVSGKTIEISAYVLSDGTEGANDRLFVNVFDQGGVGFGTFGPFVPTDTPFWTHIYIKADLPANTFRIQAGVAMLSRKGNIWVDDLSVKIDGKEVIKNGSFEN